MDDDELLHQSGLPGHHLAVSTLAGARTIAVLAESDDQPLYLLSALPNCGIREDHEGHE